MARVSHRHSRARKTAGAGVAAPVSQGGFDAHYRAGLALLDKHDYAQAISRFEAALAANPPPERQAAILFGLANAARRIGHPRAAESLYDQVLAIDPSRVEAIVNLANLHRSTGRMRDAQNLLQDALNAQPGTPELWLTLGHVMRESGDAESANTFFGEAVRLKPGYAAALASLADMFVDRGDPDQALKTYAAALRKDPGNPQIRFNRALVLLSEGKLEEGWRDYGQRFRAADPPIRFTHGLKPWTGRPLPGERLLICAEQGLGDQLIFASVFAPAMARAQARAAVIDCEPRLIPLFARSFPEATVHAHKVYEQGGVRICDYDWLPGVGGAAHAVTMGDLPALVYAKADAYPDTKAYLFADPDKLSAWRHWLGALPHGPVIGVCWRSSKMGGMRSQQFAPLRAWAEFLRSSPGIFVSLQYDGTPEEIAELAQASGRTIHVPPGLDQKNDLDGTAALISGLDAVVTAPTAVSALSAAMGTPTFKILFDRSWTGLGRDYEPLAPACRLMRPDTPGDWDQVFANTRAALASDPWIELGLAAD